VCVYVFETDRESAREFKSSRARSFVREREYEKEIELKRQR
jgi:hypothetical protein